MEARRRGAVTFTIVALAVVVFCESARANYAADSLVSAVT